MPQQIELTGRHLKAPRAAAIAGIVFSILLVTSLLLLRLAVPSDPMKPDAWIDVDSARVVFALNMMPFVGIAFLWFIGVLRDRLGAREDRLFATVFLGSGLLFLAMLFAGASVLGAFVITRATHVHTSSSFETLTFARALTANIVNIYAIKMAAVFMVLTSTLVIRTGVAARWVAILGYALSLPLLFGSRLIDWGFFVFPAWVLLISLYILADNLRRPAFTPVE